MNNIEIKIRNGETEIYSVGHCDSEVVCAGVSAIIQTCILGLIHVADNYPDDINIKIDDKRVFNREGE